MLHLQQKVDLLLLHLHLLVLPLHLLLQELDRTTILLDLGVRRRSSGRESDTSAPVTGDGSGDVDAMIGRGWGTIPCLLRLCVITTHVDTRRTKRVRNEERGGVFLVLRIRFPVTFTTVTTPVDKTRLYHRTQE